MMLHAADEHLPHLRLNLGDMGAAQVRDPLKVAPLGLGSADFGGQRAREVGEQQILARHRQAQ